MFWPAGKGPFFLTEQRASLVRYYDALASSAGTGNPMRRSTRELLYTTLVGADQVPHTPGWLFGQPSHILIFLFPRFSSFLLFLLFFFATFLKTQKI
jgi:hypothetical protein